MRGACGLRSVRAAGEALGALPWGGEQGERRGGGRRARWLRGERRLLAAVVDPRCERGGDAAAARVPVVLAACYQLGLCSTVSADETRPVSTGRGTRRVQVVREGGGIGGGRPALGAHARASRRRARARFCVQLSKATRSPRGRARIMRAAKAHRRKTLSVSEDVPA